MAFADRVAEERVIQSERYGLSEMSRDRWVSTIFEHAGRIADHANALAKLDPQKRGYELDVAAEIEGLRRQLLRTAALCESWDHDIEKRLD